MKGIEVEWTLDMISMLTRFWAEGLSANEVGRRMALSRNSIVGKVSRLGLPKRPSPIIRKPKTEPPGPTLAEIGPGQCRWPYGGPKERATYFFGEPVIEGKPYCAPHHARTHIRPSHDAGVPFHFEKMGAGNEILKRRAVEDPEIT